jgi:hypothetical protein
MPANLHTVKKWGDKCFAVYLDGYMVSLQPTEEAALKLASERNNEHLKEHPPTINPNERLD